MYKKWFFRPFGHSANNKYEIYYIEHNRSYAVAVIEVLDSVWIKHIVYCHNNQLPKDSE